MHKKLSKALLKEDYLTVARLLQQGIPLELDSYDSAASQNNRALTHTEMADYAREHMGAAGLPKSAFSLLRRAAEANCIELVTVLLDQGLDPNRRDEFGDTLWDSAITADAYQTMEYLLKHGLNSTDGIPVQGREKEPYTPMEHAVRRGTPRMVKLLLKYGADPYVLKDDPEVLPHAEGTTKPPQKVKWKVLSGKPTRAKALAFFRGTAKRRRSKKTKNSRKR